MEKTVTHIRILFWKQENAEENEIIQIWFEWKAE